MLGLQSDDESGNLVFDRMTELYFWSFKKDENDNEEGYDGSD
jgi:hypothetical protein